MVAVSEGYYESSDKLEVAIFQEIVLDLINDELESYKCLHNERPHRQMRHLSPNQVWDSEWAKRQLSGMDSNVVMYHANRILEEKAPHADSHPDTYFKESNLSDIDIQTVQNLISIHGKPTKRDEVAIYLKTIITAYRTLREGQQVG